MAIVILGFFEPVIGTGPGLFPGTNDSKLREAFTAVTDILYQRMQRTRQLAWLEIDKKLVIFHFLCQNCYQKKGNRN